VLEGNLKECIDSPHLMRLSNLIGFMVPLLTWLSNLVDYCNESRICLLFAHYENHITIIQMLSFVNLHSSISLSHDVGEVVGYVGANEN
jgi:hypothetical protein